MTRKWFSMILCMAVFGLSSSAALAKCSDKCCKNSCVHGTCLKKCGGGGDDTHPPARQSDSKAAKNGSGQT